MRIKKKSRAIRAAREIVLLPLGAVAGLHFVIRTWSSSRTLVPPPLSAVD